jgi:hypothetical protein
MNKKNMSFSVARHSTADAEAAEPSFDRIIEKEELNPAPLTYEATDESMHIFDIKPEFPDQRSVLNFSPGPPPLPRAVLEVAQKEMYNYRGSGQSVMELTHRQDEFRHISQMTKLEIRKFLQIPDNFRILINQGGATNQYTACVKNLINLKPYDKSMIIMTGQWTKQCYNEVQKYCNPRVVADLY